MGEPSLAGARAALCALAALAAAAVLDPGSPAPASATEAETEFSAARAMELVEAVASVPHPLDSPENERARQRIEARLDALDVPWERQTWQMHIRVGRDRLPAFAEGVNVVARLAGHAKGGPVALFVCHYDSRPGPTPQQPRSPDGSREEGLRLKQIDRSPEGAPGAGDDGAAVAAFLETLRALRAGPPLGNELWFLFTDGEEYGLLGAREFAEQPGALERVAVVLNFEGRGNGGPVVLFETGRDEAPWIEAYAQAVRRPQASSLGPTVYERLPNDTDFSVFKDRGLPGLNFAFIAGGSAYHQPWDTPENLDRRSLQHHGEIALGLARHLGESDLAALAAERGNSAYFTLPGNLMVRYPQRWELGVSLLALLATAGALIFGIRAGALRASGVALAALGYPVLTAGAAALLFAATWCVLRGVPAIGVALGWIGESAPRGNRASSTWTAVGVVVLAGVLAALVAARARRAWVETLAAGACVVWSGLAIAGALTVPGAAHIVTWPALFAALGLHVAVRDRALAACGESAVARQSPLVGCKEGDREAAQVPFLATEHDSPSLTPQRASGRSRSRDFRHRLLGDSAPRSAILSLAAAIPPLLLLLPVLDLLAQVGSVAALGPGLMSSLVAAPWIGLLLPCARPYFARAPRLAAFGGAATALAALGWSACLAAQGL